jgi:diguanylate cyclase (GGDEF)-like protein
VFLGGWVAKMAAALVYSTMLVAYLRWAEAEPLPGRRGIADTFQTLTYRERYEALVETVGRDGLTGLLHRGRFEIDGEKAVALSLRTGAPLSLVLIDVDHFKSINDRFGHAEGDRVLKALAVLLTRTAGVDKAFRIGGEEFAILCVHPHGMARLLGESVRNAVKSSGGDIEFTLSAGVATVSPVADSLTALFSLADKRLYLAKATGRDRVVGDGSDETPASRQATA